MRKGLLLVIACLTLANISCKKDQQIESLGDALIWEETKCGDPWAVDVDRNSTNFEAELDKWLESKTGFPIAQPLRKNVPGTAQDCTECNCKTGNVIYIFPNNSKQQEFLSMGFRKR